MYSKALNLLPSSLRTQFSHDDKWNVEEIRLRRGRLPTVIAEGREISVGIISVNQKHMESVLEKASGASMYAYEQQIKNGYINYEGIRIGICATAIFSAGELRAFKDLSSLDIRLPGKFKGNIDGLLSSLRETDFKSTLIISPPGQGKTTLLRELVRRVSNEGRRISVVDDRNEISASSGAEAYYDLGFSSDVMVGVPKKEASIMLLRSMNPQIIALDEISHSEDIQAVLEICGCGVEIFATAHGASLDELRQRRLYRAVLEENIFSNIVTIKSFSGTREYGYMRLNR